MTRGRRPIPIVLLVLVQAASGVPIGAEILLTNVNVVPMTCHEIIRDCDVLIRDDRFAAIQPTGTTASPVRGEVIDGAGGYLIPGLMDMHVHLKERREVQPDMLFLYLANGVTTVLSMSGSDIVLNWRQQVEKGDLVGPRIFTTSPIIGVISASPTTSEKAYDLVEQYAQKGYDFIKVYNKIPEAGYWGIIGAAKEFKIPVVGHAVRSVGIQGAIEAGQHVAHMEEFLYGYFQEGLDESRIQPLAQDLKEAGVVVIATLIAYHNIIRQLEDIEAMLHSPGVEYLPWRLVKPYQPENNTYLKRFGTEDAKKRLEQSMSFMQKTTRAFHEKGVVLLAGTDAVMAIVVPGFSLHQELAELVDAGLSPYAALQAASTLPAAFLGVQDEAGTIEVGKLADAVLLTANPLEDIAHTRRIAGVFFRGNWLSKKEIDAHLEGIKKRAIQSRDTQ